MKSIAFAVLGLVAVAALSGCSGDKDDESDDDDMTSPEPTGSDTDTSGPPGPPPPPPPPPMPPQQVFNGSLKFALDGNDDPAAFQVSENVSMLEINFTVTTTGQGPYSLAGPGTPPSGDPSLNLTDPNGQVIALMLNQHTVALSTGGGMVVDEQQTEVAPVPPMGSWTVSIAGTGQNLQVDVVLTEVFG